MAPAQNVETQKQKKPALKTARQKRTFNAKARIYNPGHLSCKRLVLLAQRTKDPIVLSAKYYMIAFLIGVFLFLPAFQIESILVPVRLYENCQLLTAFTILIYSIETANHWRNALLIQHSKNATY